MLEYVQDGCFSFQFYIKPQLAITILALACRCFSFQFYIKPQHHRRCRCSAEGCFSFQFYIKPQHLARGSSIRIVVSHSNSTSNHNSCMPSARRAAVVSHSNSTSNHNKYTHTLKKGMVVSHSNSTSNHNVSASPKIKEQLFLIPILHQTTTKIVVEVFESLLFLIPILHQTTTSRMAVIHILHVTHMTPMHKTSCRTPGKLVGCNFVFQRAIYQKNSSC